MAAWWNRVRLPKSSQIRNRPIRASCLTRRPDEDGISPTSARSTAAPPCPRPSRLLPSPVVARAQRQSNPARASLRTGLLRCARNDDLRDRVHVMTRIAVGGFLHETNTFAPTKATYEAFVHGGGWPSMTHGDDVLKVMRGINVGLAGFVEEADARGWEMIPTIACGASPSAHVTEDAYEGIVGEITAGIAAAMPLDAVYLDLHGAMVTEHLDDGEGEIARRVRAIIGPDIPFVVSLDLHGNISPETVEHTDALIAYRTYPHVDMADTGRACARHLDLLLTGNRYAKAFRQLPFLIPISWQCTNDQPTRGIYQMLAALEDEQVPTLSFCPGFPAADFEHCCPSVFAYGVTQADADAAADTIVRLVSGHEDDFDGKIYTPDEGVLHAMELAKSATKPIVIADT